MRVLPIKSEEASPWILQKHYAKRLPSISYAFGLFDGNVLVGVVTYGMPASPFLCVGVCGEQHRNIVLELNRLCLLNNKKNISVLCASVCSNFSVALIVSRVLSIFSCHVCSFFGCSGK